MGNDRMAANHRRTSHPIASCKPRARRANRKLLRSPLESRAGWQAGKKSGGAQTASRKTGMKGPHLDVKTLADDHAAVVRQADPEKQKFGFVAIIGATNAGKSTLVNQLVGTKVTIVSHKVQTTRMPIRGIAIEDASQLVFVDTPGIFKPRRRLDRAMVKAAWGGAGEADIVVMLFDAQRGVDDETREMVKRLADVGAPACLALNKIDAIDKARLLNIAQELNAHGKFLATFMISALKGAGVDDLKRYLANAVPKGQWHYPADDVTDAPMRILASEITREKIYARLHEELPYATTVETTSWKEMGKRGRPDRANDIRRTRQPKEHRPGRRRPCDQENFDRSA